jgi:hypothetical protein
LRPDHSGRNAAAAEPSRCTSALAAGQQLADGRRVQPVGLAPPVALLFAHRGHLRRVQQAHHELVTVKQMTGERLMVVPGRFDPDHDYRRIRPCPGGQEHPLELGQPSPVGDQAHAIHHDLAEQVGRDHKPGRLGHIDPDQQHPPRVNAIHQLQERTCPLAPDVGTMHHRPAPFC